MTFCRRVFGPGPRHGVCNSVFGANAGTDAFWVAFRIPNFMRRLSAEGSFSIAFVPVLTEIQGEADPRRAEGTGRRAPPARWAGCCWSSSRWGCSSRPQVTLLFAPGAARDPAKFALTVDAAALTFPFLLFVSLTALAGGALNSYHSSPCRR